MLPGRNSHSTANRRAAEVRTAIITRHLDRVLQTGRRENPFVARTRDVIAKARRFRRIVEVRAQILHRERLPREWRRRGRERGPR